MNWTIYEKGGGLVMKKSKEQIKVIDAINDVTFRLEDVYNFSDMVISIMDSGAWDIQPEDAHPTAFLTIVRTMAEKTKESATDAAKELSKIYPEYDELKRVIKHMEG
jgi:hypothetical protein